MATHAHVTKRPLQVRCSSQPIGLRSSFRRIQPSKNTRHSTGVQKVPPPKLPRRRGLLLQEWRMFRLATITASRSMHADSSVTCTITHGTSFAGSVQFIMKDQSVSPEAMVAKPDGESRHSCVNRHPGFGARAEQLPTGGAVPHVSTMRRGKCQASRQQERAKPGLAPRRCQQPRRQGQAHGIGIDRNRSPPPPTHPAQQERHGQDR